MLIAKLMKVDTKLMKIVLFCTKFKLNEAAGNKAKVGTNLVEKSVWNSAEFRD
jgi:hypothetical protein